MDSMYLEIRDTLVALPKSTDKETGIQLIADKFFLGNVRDAMGTIGAIEDCSELMPDHTQNEARGTARLYWWRIPTEADKAEFEKNKFQVVPTH